MKNRFLAILLTSLVSTSLQASGFNSFTPLKFSANTAVFNPEKRWISAFGALVMAFRAGPFQDYNFNSH